MKKDYKTQRNRASLIFVGAIAVCIIVLVLLAKFKASDAVITISIFGMLGLMLIANIFGPIRAIRSNGVGRGIHIYGGSTCPLCGKHLIAANLNGREVTRCSDYPKCKYQK